MIDADVYVIQHDCCIINCNYDTCEVDLICWNGVGKAQILETIIINLKSDRSMSPKQLDGNNKKKERIGPLHCNGKGIYIYIAHPSGV